LAAKVPTAGVNIEYPSQNENNDHIRISIASNYAGSFQIVTIAARADGHKITAQINFKQPTDSGGGEGDFSSQDPSHTPEDMLRDADLTPILQSVDFSGWTKYDFVK
jgi:hypothetical protein